jgi:hypothetical protein
MIWSVLTAIGGLLVLVGEYLEWSIDRNPDIKLDFEPKVCTFVGAILVVVASLFGAISNAKQQGVQEALLGKTKDLVTGGNSYAWLKLIEDPESGTLRAQVNHAGDDVPAYDVNIKIIGTGQCDDLEKWTMGKALARGNDRLHSFPAITKDSFAFLDISFEPSCDDALYSLLIQMRNRSVIQLIRLLKVNGKWLQATRILSFPSRKLIQEFIDNDFPIPAKDLKWPQGRISGEEFYPWSEDLK